MKKNIFMFGAILICLIAYSNVGSNVSPLSLDEAKEKNTSDSFIFLEHIISKNKPNTEDKLKKRISAIAQHNHTLSHCDKIHTSFPVLLI